MNALNLILFTPYWILPQKSDLFDPDLIIDMIFLYESEYMQKEVLPRFELGLLDSKSKVLTITP